MTKSSSIEWSPILIAFAIWFGVGFVVGVMGMVFAVAYSARVGGDVNMDGPIVTALSLHLQAASVFVGALYLVHRVSNDVRRHCLIYGKAVLLFSLAFTFAIAFITGDFISWIAVVNLIIIIPSALFAQVISRK